MGDSPAEHRPSYREGERTCCHLWLCRLLAALCVLFDPFQAPDWPARGGASSALASRSLGVREARAAEDTPELGELAAILRQPICVVSKQRSFGTLGDSLLFVYRKSGETLRVGYFVYWDVERPWGANVQTYTLLPALAIDSAYTHFMFILPGLQRALYGAGDVEGATVVYENGANGLEPVEVWAEISGHDEVRLSPDDFRTADARIALMTDVWSHQLGARGAGLHAASAAESTCFSGDALRQLDIGTARSFRLGTPTHPLRARAAWRALSET